MLLSKVVAPPKDILCSLLCLIAGNSFFQSTVFLIFKWILYFLEEHLQPWIAYIWCNVFDIYFYLRRVVISKELLQPYIWVESLIFHETICSDKVFLKYIWLWKIFDLNRLNETRWKSRISSQDRKK